MILIDRKDPNKSIQIGVHRRITARREPVILWNIETTEVIWGLYEYKCGDKERFSLFICIKLILIYKSQSRPNKIPDTKNNQPNEKGKNIFQPNLINWSYLYLGKAALTQTNKNRIIVVFKPNQKKPGNILENGI